MTYDIIKKNLEKLDSASKTFPNIIGKYRKSKDEKEKQPLRALANQLGLSGYINFIDWIDKLADIGQSVIINHNISFKELKTTMAEAAIDEEAKKFLLKKTRPGFLTFLKSSNESCGDWSMLSGDGYRRRRSVKRRSYSRNFQNSESILANYLIQNSDDFTDIKLSNIVSTFYRSEIPSVEVELNTELDITKDISKSILRKISTIKYDFRKLNYNILKAEIESKIKAKMLSVEKGEQLKCIEEHRGITTNNFYNVISYELGGNGNLIVCVHNDLGDNAKYSYRLFESVSILRDNHINDILKQLQ